MILAASSGADGAGASATGSLMTRSCLGDSRKSSRRGREEPSGSVARRFRGLGLAPIDVATGQLTASALILAPIAAFVDAPWTLPLPGAPTLVALVLYALLSTALAYIVFFRILAGAGATNVGLVTVLAPASTIMLGALVLGERLDSRDFLGLALIACGIAFVDGRLPARLAARWRRAAAA